MEITLIRHGKSACLHERNMTSEKFSAWVKRYDDNGVITETAYPEESLRKIRMAELIVTSDLKRSIQSAALLSNERNTVSLPLFRETDLPTLSSNIRGLVLHSTIWASVLRILWFCGYSNGKESFRHAKQRAETAADHLIELAHKHEKIALVGHGFFNRFIAKELVKKGWHGARNVDSKH
ncbi:histidine phosphatase family protein [Gracilibacillus oryzae]|uniref:Histidine phosphatase family protein n=1 Tax=Gracilibacillus oryzae TaxID=1672701 RepID=A0A7C8KMA8_9BACI|nr:histidine phosphatase family protein [Gracilibacillus oryzae]KAB8125936.1 histidine phosphatase family protein [Gracilibacillus oryzae]